MFLISADHCGTVQPTGRSLVGGCLALAAVDLSSQQFGRNVFQEPTWFLQFAGTPHRALGGVYQVEAAHGAGDADVGQATLFGHVLLVLASYAAGMRQQALFHPDHKDYGKLQPFSGV